MKEQTGKRHKILSFKVTDGIDQALTAIRLKVSNRDGSIVSKTDIIEAAIRLLCDKESITIK